MFVIANRSNSHFQYSSSHLRGEDRDGGGLFHPPLNPLPQGRGRLRKGTFRRKRSRDCRVGTPLALLLAMTKLLIAFHTKPVLPALSWSKEGSVARRRMYSALKLLLTVFCTLHSALLHFCTDALFSLYTLHPALYTA